MQAPRDENRIATLLAVSNVDGITPVTLWADPTTHRLLVDFSALLSSLTDVNITNPLNGQVLSYDTASGKWINSTSGAGTVTSVSVVSANGLAGTVANATTTPAITLSTSVTGLLKGNGTALSAATSGTDYSAGTSALATGILKSTTTTGALTIAVAGDFPTLNQNTTGSAATLTTPRAIYGNNFDGSAALTQIIASTYGGTGNGFTKFTGPTTTEKTFTLPDLSATLLYSGGALGTPASGTLTNCTFPTLNQDTTGSAVYWKTSGTGKAALSGPGTGTTRTYTGPDADATLARTDAAQTFTGTQTFSQVITTNNAITASGNAATVPITSKINTVTNNSAATLTITMTTTSAVDGQISCVRVLDATAVAQTITWVNTENSDVSAPTSSNGSTTLPRTVLFQYNSNTSKWRCLANS